MEERELNDRFREGDLARNDKEYVAEIGRKGGERTPSGKRKRPPRTKDTDGLREALEQDARGSRQNHENE